MSRPLVAVIADTSRIGKHLFHVAGEKYLAAVTGAAGCVPMILPVLPDPVAWADYADRIDAVLMTGALSNVDPGHYGGPKARPGTLADPQRDGTALPLIRSALADAVPLLAICRGFQELNVAMGGTLHAHLAEVPGRFDHRERDDDPLDVQYGPAHAVDLVPDGALCRMFGAKRIMVNSLHGQGIDRLASGLVVEGVAEDGTIEAVAVRDAPAFAFGVQWHPEWKPHETAHHRQLFEAFGAAARERRDKRR